MSARPDKPREYFRKLLNMREDEIDYGDSPPTTHADWEDAEVLLPASSEKSRKVQDRVRTGNRSAIRQRDLSEGGDRPPRIGESRRLKPR